MQFCHKLRIFQQRWVVESNIAQCGKFTVLLFLLLKNGKLIVTKAIGVTHRKPNG
jgi:hypothetical protein